MLGGYLIFVDEQNNLIYASSQIAPFSYGIAEDYTEISPNKIYQFKNLFLENIQIPIYLLHKYEIENTEIGDKKIVIGCRLNETQIFNFETYAKEEYTGCEISNLHSNYQNELDKSTLKY